MTVSAIIRRLFLYFAVNLGYNELMNNCRLCPVSCGADRTKTRGACGGDDKIRIGYMGVHFGEEPPISLGRGSGAVFFSGCPLGCVFCQNAKISASGVGKIYSQSELESALLKLGEQCENINLVTAGHMLYSLLPVLERVKPKLKVPVIYNSGGYEKVEALKRLDGIVDVYLPDYKYFSPELAEKYSKRKNYPEIAVAAIDEMVGQQPKLVFEKTQNGKKIVRGVIVRHLVLPGARKDSMDVMHDVGDRWGKQVLVSIMSQYTPEFNRSPYPELDRKVTSFEYDSVVAEAQKIGLDGFMQQKSSATSALTPKFEE